MKAFSLIAIIILSVVSFGCILYRNLPSDIVTDDKLPATKLTSIKQIIAYTDAVYASRHPTFDSLDYLRELNEVFIGKYKHSFLLYSFADNFVLYFFSLLTENKHRGIVIPDHIAQHNIGICSQQALLFIETAGRKGYRARALRLNKHFCCEVFANAKWRFIDVNLKLSNIGKVDIPSGAEIKTNSAVLQSYYLNRIQYKDKALAATFFDWIEPAPENTFAAPNLRLLHWVSSFLSDYLWVVCWVIFLVLGHFQTQSKSISSSALSPEK